MEDKNISPFDEVPGFTLNEFGFSPFVTATDPRLADALIRLSKAEELHTKACDAYAMWTHSVDIARRNLTEAEAKVADITAQAAATLIELTAARKAVVSAAKEAK